MDVSVEIDGFLKTATEKDIINKIEEEFKMKQQLLREERKVLDWSDAGDNESARSLKSEKESKKGMNVYNNGAISIIDNKNGRMVGELDYQN